MRRNALSVLLFFSISSFVALSAGAATLTASLTVNAGVTLNTFAPISIFGNNLGYWNAKSDVLATQTKIEAAGNFCIRYPGGSSSDDYHWNGSGSYDSNQHWVSDDVAYQPGFAGYEMHRGTSSSYGTPSFLMDGNTSTAWLSNADTNFPNAQWVYVDLGSNQTPNAVTIVWGDPYATQFTVQYWPLSSTNQWSPYNHTSNDWFNTTAANVVGAGGTQGVTFSQVTSRYLRILLTASSVSPAQYSIAEWTVFNGATQVSKNVSTVTGSTPDQTLCVASSTDVANTLNYFPDFDFESYMAVMRSMNPPGIPVITINFGTGTPQEAAAWVHYAHAKGYGIKYWQIGNETEGTWETGGPINAQDYVRRYIEFYDAMKAEDPSIIVTGPVAGGLLDAANLYDGKTVTQDFISLLHTQGKDAYINALDFHWYPNYGNYTEATALASVTLMDNYPATIQSWLSGVTNASAIPVMMTEFNVDPGDEHFQVILPEGMWVADALGRFIKGFGNRGFTNLWGALGGSSAVVSLTGGGLSYLQTEVNANQYQERPSYWAEKLMTNQWTIPGDSTSHALVSSVSSQSLLPAYADYRPDGVLSLMVVNKDPGNSYATTVNLGAFTPNGTANAWRFDSSNYAWTTASLPYHAAPDTAPTTFTQAGVASSFPMTFGPYSITVLQFTNASYPTNTPTSTPTITVTPTPTATVHYGPVTLIDDFENPAREGLPPIRACLWGGPWTTAIATNSSITISYGSPGANGTNRSARASGVIGVSPTPGWSDFSVQLYSGWPVPSFNASGNGLAGLQFWFYGDGATYRVCMTSTAVTDYNFYGIVFTPPAGTWSFYQVPFSSMTRQAGWGSQTGLPPTFPATDATGVQFSTQGSPGAFDYRVDQLEFFDATAGSPVPTATKTRTGTPTMTPTVTPTLTETLSPTLTPTETQTLSPTPTGSATATFTASNTSTPTWTTTITATPTSTPTPTLSAGRQPVLWPNPVRDGDEVQLIVNPSIAGRTRVRCFTMSYRLAADQTWDLMAEETKLTVVLRDSGGKTFANGLYYLMVDTPNGKSILKLLVLR